MASTSERLRLKGNSLLRSAEGMSLCLRVPRLHQVEDLYTRALKTAGSAAERAACHKNLAACHLHQARLDSCAHSRTGPACKAVSRAVMAYTEALLLGQSCQPAQWLADARTRRSKALDHGRSLAAKTEDHSLLLSFCSELCGHLADRHGTHKGHLAIQLAQALFHAGINCQEANNTRQALRLFAAAATPLTIAEQVKQSPEDLVASCTELRDSLHRHECIASSAQATTNADKLVRDSINDNEELPVDTLWQAADMYREAIVLTRDKDVIGEAKACSRLGLLYYNLLGDKARAMPLLRTCMQLAHTLVPVPLASAWFEAAKEAIRVEQAAAVNRTTAEWQEKKGPILQALKPELDACKKEAGKGFKALVHHIYTAHPPKAWDSKIPDCAPEKWKFALQIALRHYHPDHHETDPDDQWYVLCEEITKLVNIQYSKL